MNDAGAAAQTRAKQAASAQAAPWDALSTRDRKLVGRVVNGATLTQTMPSRTVACEPELFALLIERPELVVEVWNLMGISTLVLDPTGPTTYRALDEKGADGEVRVVYNGRRPGEWRTVVAYCSGRYEAPPMPKPLSAESVLVFRWSPVTGRDGRARIRADLDAYVTVDQPAARLLAKAISPLLSRTAEHNFVETLRFVALFSKTAERNPAGMVRLANHLQKIDQPTRDRFVQVCRAASDRSVARRRVAVAGDPLSIPPLR